MAADPPGGFGVDEAGVFQVVAAEAVGGEEGVGVGVFDADVVVLRVGLGDGDEEGAFAGADFEFDGVIVGEDFAPGDAAGFVGEVEEKMLRIEVGS